MHSIENSHVFVRRHSCVGSMEEHRKNKCMHILKLTHPADARVTEYFVSDGSIGIHSALCFVLSVKDMLRIQSGDSPKMFVRRHHSKDAASVVRNSDSNFSIYSASIISHGSIFATIFQKTFAFPRGPINVQTELLENPNQDGKQLLYHLIECLRSWSHNHDTLIVDERRVDDMPIRGSMLLMILPEGSW